MTTVKEIENAVAHLRPGELVEFRRWFEEMDTEVWDKSFVSDALSGKLDKIANVAISDFKNGES